MPSAPLPACLIDISRLLARAGAGRLPTGVDRVCLRYIARWGVQARAVLIKQNWRRMLGTATSQALFEHLVQPRAFEAAGRMQWEIAKAMVPPWPSQNAEGALALYLGHTGLERPDFAPWLRRTGQRPVYLVHDLIPITHPEYCRAGEDAHHRQRMAVVLQTAAGVIANSSDTLRALAAFAAETGHSLPPTAVAPLASGLDKPSAATERPLGAPFFVTLGTIEPRKNHLLLLNLWRELVARLGAAAPKLVVVGQRGWECEQVVDMLERCAALRDHVIEVPNADDAALCRWLSHAQALLFPSFAEGFGMPLVEALGLGLPVLASDLPVFQEFAGGVPEWLSPVDGLGWLQAVLDYSDTQHPRRQAQLARLAHWHAPTWDDHFAAVDALLLRLGQSG
jgi:glycosyltransferase involved in cell wall biosynthesis